MSRPAATSNRRRRFAALVIVLGALGATASVAEAQNPPEAVEYYAVDALGSVRVVYTASGEVLGRSDYLPFGETRNQSGALPKQRFTGQERDGEAGLDDFNARNFQPRAGRMTAPDPVFGDAMTNPQRWNRYAYALNNPLSYADPSGMDAVDIDKLLQDCWGLKAWDDFSQDYWAQGTGYSYGPFSSTLIELSRKGISWDRIEFDNGGGIVAGFSEANAGPALDALGISRIDKEVVEYLQHFVTGLFKVELLRTEIGTCGCQGRSGFEMMPPTVGREGAGEVLPTPCTRGTTKVVEAHSHPIQEGATHPSGDDMHRVQPGIEYYVWTPRPNGPPSPSGVVWKYNRNCYWTISGQSYILVCR